MSSIHIQAFLIAIVHYLLSFCVAFLAFAVAWGWGQSDAGLGPYGFILVVLQAPVALIQWLVVHWSIDGKTGLEIPALALAAIPSSLIYGYVIALLFRRPKPKHDRVA